MHDSRSMTLGEIITRCAVGSLGRRCACSMRAQCHAHISIDEDALRSALETVSRLFLQFHGRAQQIGQVGYPYMQPGVHTAKAPIRGLSFEKILAQQLFITPCWSPGWQVKGEGRKWNKLHCSSATVHGLNHLPLSSVDLERF